MSPSTPEASPRSLRTSRPNPLVQLVLFRSREFTREPAIMFWALVFPLLMMGVLGVAFRPQKAAPVPVLLARTADPSCEKIEHALAASKDLVLLARPLAEAELALARGEAALLVVPGSPPVYRYDETHPEARTTRLLADVALGELLGERARISPRQETATAPGARYIDWFVPGMLGMAIMNGCLWGVGFALVEMRAKRLLKRFAVTPMARWQFLLAQAIHRFAIVAVEATLIVGFSALAFGVRVRGSLFAFALLTALGTFAFAAIGLVVAARPRNTEVAAGLMNIPMLPMMVVSGVFFSSTRFPDALQPAIKALPLTALIDGLRKVANEGAGLDAVLRELGVLVIWSIVTLSVALRFFKWT